MKNLVLRPVGGGDPKYTCREWKDFLDKCANADDALKLAVMDGFFPVWLKGECPIGYQWLDGVVGGDWTKWRGHEFIVGVILMSVQDQDKLPESLKGMLPDDLVKLVSEALAPNGGNVARAEVVKFLEDYKNDLLRVYDDETGLEAELNFWKLSLSRAAVSTRNSDADDAADNTQTLPKSSGSTDACAKHTMRDGNVCDDEMSDDLVLSSERVLSRKFNCEVFLYKWGHRVLKNGDWFEFRFGTAGENVFGCINLCGAVNKVKPGNKAEVVVSLQKQIPVANNMGFTIWEWEDDCAVGKGKVLGLCESEDATDCKQGCLKARGQNDGIGIAYEKGSGWSVELNFTFRRYDPIYLKQWLDLLDPYIEFSNGVKIPVLVLYNAFGDYKLYCERIVRV